MTDRPIWEFLPPRPVEAREVAACLPITFAETIGEDIYARAPVGSDDDGANSDPPYDHLLVFDSRVHYLVLDDTEATMLVDGEPVEPDDPEFGEYVGPAWRKVGSVEDGPGVVGEPHNALREWPLAVLGDEVARARTDGSRRYVHPDGGYADMTPELAEATREDLTRDREKALVNAADEPLAAFMDSDLDPEDYVDEDDLKEPRPTDLDQKIAQAKADAEDLGTVVDTGDPVVVDDRGNKFEIPRDAFDGDPPSAGAQATVEDLDLEPDPSSGSYALDPEGSDGETDTAQRIQDADDEGPLYFPDDARIDTEVSLDSSDAAVRTHLDHPQGRVEVVLSMNAIAVRVWRDGTATLLADAAVSLGSPLDLHVARKGTDLYVELRNSAGKLVESLTTQAWPDDGGDGNMNLLPPRYDDLDGNVAGLGDLHDEREARDDPTLTGANPPTYESANVTVQNALDPHPNCRSTLEPQDREVSFSATVEADEDALDALRYMARQAGGRRE